MQNSNLKVPEKVSFEQAIELTQSLISQIEAGELSEEEIAVYLADLFKTDFGSRGFFVSYLTSDSSLPDSPSPAVIQALKTNSEIIADLLVKNLAMSAASTVAHRRNNNPEMVASSERVTRRTTNLIELLQVPAIYQHSQNLLETVTNKEGSYKSFLERWGYDAEQQQAICQALKLVIPAVK
ncbi:MAG TPA: hypothetical protein V6D15_23420 [Oculatellaceae cyanobacterium]|jgi:hypothetical protein